jgi:hypothetical protein
MEGKMGGIRPGTLNVFPFLHANYLCKYTFAEHKLSQQNCDVYIKIILYCAIDCTISLTLTLLS